VKASHRAIVEAMKHGAVLWASVHNGHLRGKSAWLAQEAGKPDKRVRRTTIDEMVELGILCAEREVSFGSSDTRWTLNGVKRARSDLREIDHRRRPKESKRRAR